MRECEEVKVQCVTKWLSIILQLIHVVAFPGVDEKLSSVVEHAPILAQRKECFCAFSFLYAGKWGFVRFSMASCGFLPSP